MSERKPPRIEDAPGLVWRERKNGWVATWQARTDLVKKGYSPQTARLWDGGEPNEIEASHIATQCRRLQADMKVWAKEGEFAYPDMPANTLRDLVNKYQTDEDSNFHKKRFAVRQSQVAMMRRIVARFGDVQLADIKGRMLLAWHREWSGGGQKMAAAHDFISHLRTVLRFGAAILEHPDCIRLRGVLTDMRFEMSKPRTERLTAEQAVAIREKAHQRGWAFLALAQAVQFELMLRQKDVIGEWVPVTEPGISAVIQGNQKWIMGIRWENIDEALTLRHKTSKRGKDIEVSLRLAGMVMEEFEKMFGIPAAEIQRAHLPASGPVILCEVNGWPYRNTEFRRKWRKLANAAGIPKEVKNMDSRAGAISEATDAGADLEHVRHAATHSDIGMTQRYSRGSTDKVAGVMTLRAEHRNKPRKK